MTTAEVGRARRPAKPRPSLFGIGVGLAMVVLTVLTVWDWEYGTGFSLRAVFEKFGNDNPVISAIPDTDWDQMFSARTRAAFVETLRLAILGTSAGVIVALPLALWSTRFGAPNRSVRFVVRAVTNVIRAFPDILWALLFVSAVGIGALPGLLSLFFFSIAVVTKLTADTLDGIDPGPLEAAHASGARHSQMLRSRGRAADPPGLRLVLALCVRAQPAGIERDRPRRGGRRRRTDRVLRVAEQLGSSVGHRRDVRHRRVHRRPHLDAVAEAARMTAGLQSPRAPVGTPTTGTKRPARPVNVAKWATLGAWAVLVVWSILGLNIKWSRLLEAPADLYRLFELMFTQLEASDIGRCLRAMWDSIAMAWLGTLIAAVFAVPLGFLAAENLVPRWFSFFIRQLFNVLRAIPELILVLALIPVLGLTESAGVLAIAIGSVGTLGKLCSEIIEGIDRGPIEAADSVGASQLQRLRWAVVPQTMPEIASFVLYRFEINIRVSSVLGVLGIGGIGQILNDGLRFKEWGLAGMALIVVVGTTILIDTVSGAVRRRILAGPSGVAGLKPDMIVAQTELLGSPPSV